jgi:hypothetical protein
MNRYESVIPDNPVLPNQCKTQFLVADEGIVLIQPVPYCLSLTVLILGIVGQQRDNGLREMVAITYKPRWVVMPS